MPVHRLGRGCSVPAAGAGTRTYASSPWRSGGRLCRTFDPMHPAGFRLWKGDVEARWINANRLNTAALRRELWRA
jgi:hypothetical protein